MSKFNFLDLTEDVRQFMISEIKSDLSKNKFYIGASLNETGKKLYLNLLLDAVKNGDEEMMASSLKEKGCFSPTYIRADGRSATTPKDSAERLSRSEFNRYYIRGVCLDAIKAEGENVEIYRARESSQARSSSDEKIGLQISAKDLLEDLRNSIGVQPQILPEVNSGLSVKLVK